MTSIFRIIKPSFDPPATTRNAGVRPASTPNLDVAAADRGAVLLAKRIVARRQTAR